MKRDVFDYRAEAHRLVLSFNIESRNRLSKSERAILQLWAWLNQCLDQIERLEEAQSATEQTDS